MGDSYDGVNIGLKIGVDIPFEKIFDVVGQIVKNYLDRKQAVKDQQWELLILTLDSLKDLTKLHLAAINSVVKPISDSKNFISTFQKFKVLVHDQNIPIAYAEIKGVLEGATNWKIFSYKSDKYPHLKAVVEETFNFQYAAFMLGVNSWVMEDHFTEAEILYKILDNGQDIPDLERRKKEVREIFVKAYDNLNIKEGEPAQKIFPPLESKDDLVSIAKIWCEAWRRNAEVALYGKKGLFFAIGQLEADKRQ